MASFSISGPVVTLNASGDTLLVAGLSITTTRIPRRRLSGEVVVLTQGEIELPTSGQIWPLGLV